MKKILNYFLSLLSLTQIVLGAQAKSRTICYYDPAKMSPFELKNALEYCSHLVYGYADITSDSYEITQPNADTESFSRQLLQVRSKFPHLKVYLSLGGEIYKDGVDNEKYIQFLKGGRLLYPKFLKSSVYLLKTKSLDGLDLAFQLPRNEPRRVYSALERVVNFFQSLFNADSVVDQDAESLKLHFTEFVNDLHEYYAKENLSISLTVLPNVNSSRYFDIPKIHNKFEFINLFAFDFLTPERNPAEADYTAPIYFKNEHDRLPYNNIDFQVQHWLNNGCPADKLNLGIPTYARTWKTTKASGTVGAPVVSGTAGPGAAGIYTKTKGLLSWPEVCSKVTINYTAIAACSATNAPANNFPDLEGRYGNYAFCPADDNNNNGIWFSYDDPRVAGLKAQYAKEKNLGGVALFDLVNDDFGGVCSEEKYPILKSVHKVLSN